MISLLRMRNTVLLTMAALITTSPSAAAIKSKPTATRVKPHAQASSHLKVSSSSTSAKSSSHKSIKTAVATTRKGRKGRAQTAVASKPKFRGQQSIDSARTTEIQEALIREHYLTGSPSGEWDQATRDALTRFQGDNHWQTKILPDSRALIKLGLGPNQQGLLNPESAAIAMPYKAGLEKSAAGGSN